MRALVVGSSGFLGRALVQALLDEGAQVRGVHHQHGERSPADIVSVPSSELASQDAPEVVFVVAAWIPYGRMDTADERLLDANVRLVDQAHRAFPSSRLVLASSVAVYGTAASPLHERSPSVEPQLYGLTKLAGEAVARHHGSHAVVRFSSLCGPGMSPQTFVPRVIEQARREGSVVLWGDGSRQQDYLHVGDAAQALLAAGRSQANGVFLGVSGQSVANRSIAEYVARKTQAAVRFEREDPSPSVHFDPSWTRRMLSIMPRRTVFDAIEEMLVHGH